MPSPSARRTGGARGSPSYPGRHGDSGCAWETTTTKGAEKTLTHRERVAAPKSSLRVRDAHARQLLDVASGIFPFAFPTPRRVVAGFKKDYGRINDTDPMIKLNNVHLRPLQCGYHVVEKWVESDEEFDKLLAFAPLHVSCQIC